MTGLEAIPKITALIGELIQRTKDGQTLALLQQIQQQQLVIHKDLLEASAKMAKMEVDHSQALTALRESHRLEITNLHDQLAQLKASPPKRFKAFQEHNGVLWRKTAAGFEERPYCAECAQPRVMTGNPSINNPYIWICSAGHTAPGSVKPPPG